MKPAPSKLPPRPASFLELLEERIAPAIIEGGIATTVAGTPILLGDGVDSQGRQLPRGLGSDGPFAGGYYLYVEKGQALVFTTDLNGDNIVDPNEITGIAAGDGLRLLSFVNINGDIATNLNADGTLTDSDGDASNGRDGSVVLNNRIEAITLRSVVQEDLTTSTDPNSPAFGNTAFNRLVESRYSIYGNIYAGRGFGTLAADGSTATFGLLMDTSGLAVQGSKYSNLWFNDVEPTPSVGSIFTGTAVSGHQFSFGTSVIPAAGDRDTGTLIVRGSFDSFTPAAGAAGGDVIGIRAVTGPDLTPADYYIAGIQTGDGGFGAKGGDIRNVNLQGDVGGFFAIAGNGGNGVSGGAGGSVLGFVATASPNSTVTIQTGDGGFGLLGAAGRAGNFQAGGTIDLYGKIVVGLGSGGDSTGNAGVGTNLASATFQRFEPGDPAPVNFISTMRAPGELGTATPFDFDGDGVFDVVFLTQNTQQLGVAFGDGSGGFLSDFLILDPSIYATSDLRMSPVAVADLNDDGFAEIITASSSGTTFGGIKTFWNLGNDPFTGQWLGFDAPRYSPSPFGDRGVDTNLAVGDFDRDGVIDVALVENFRNLTDPITYSSAITLLSGLRGADGASDGFFAANYAKDRVTGLPTLSPSALIAVRESEVQVILKATASEKDNVTSDVLVGLTRKVGDIDATVNTYGFVPALGMSSLGNDSVILYSVRSIDGNGMLVYNSPPSIIEAYDFSLVDVADDDVFDVAVFGEFDGLAAAAVFPGTALGALGPQPVLPGNYYGIAITAPDAKPGEPQIPRVVASPLEHKVSRAIDINPGLGDVAYGAEVNTDPRVSARIFSFSIKGFGQSDITVTGAPLGLWVQQDAQAVLNSGAATRDMYFGVYKPTLLSLPDYAGLSRPDVAAVWALGPVALLPVGAPLVTNSLDLLAGNGGQSYLGRGGDGGSIGAGVVAFNSAGVRTGSITELGFSEAVFQAGNAGSGFLGGGNGGGLAGISTQGLTRIFITGSGGDGLLGNGGNGGTYSGNFFDGVNTISQVSSLLVQAGDGGFGLRGGNGGRVVGGGDPNVPDTVVHELTVFGGNGGEGITGGGAGGAISNFQPQMGRGSGVPVIFSASLLNFAGGSGGDAVAGPGGAGGSITSSSPTPGYNSFIRGELELYAGAGGDGLAGGSGGSVVQFFNRPTTPSSPDSASVFGGEGGDGVTGTGGKGGNVQGVQVSTSGLTLFAVLGGNGGLSSAGAGGAGGSLLGGTAGNQVASGAGSMVAAAGAGGVGFTRGGAGGSVSGSYNASTNANGGVVAIAGAGGSAYGVNFATIQKENPSWSGVSAAAMPLFQQLWTLGSANGVGGNGGSISNFTQPAGTNVSTDLIAGNGGSTINYGVVSDQTTGVGRGGSISNVKLAGDAGTWAQNLAIKSYVAFGRPMNDFVADVRATTVTTLDPTVGNVGVVVGQAGFVRNDQPATAGVTGSVSGFEAKRIMSMVAGSVDRLAAITSVSGLRFSQAGAFKVGDASGPVTHVNGNAFYAGSDYTGGVVKDASPGGTLVDGAVLTRKFTALPGQPAPQRLFTIA
jgi:hypothetical protein